MQTVSYIANGETTTFYFNFPYFERDNIVVTVNNGPAPAYNIIGTKGGLDPDFPFISGRIVFLKPPKYLATITIERRLPLARPVDFQPLSHIIPTMLNQDMNYTIELLKDMRDELDALHQNYSDIADKEATALLLGKIDLVNQNIANVSQKIDSLDGITGLPNEVAELQKSLSGLSNTVESINQKTSGITDYLTSFQEPTAENNYTWYRKYNSGWVEQGGQATMPSKNGLDITMPIPMADSNYTVLTHVMDDNQTGYVFEVQIKNKTNRTFNSKMIASYQSGSWTSGYNFAWHVSGLGNA